MSTTHSNDLMHCLGATQLHLNINYHCVCPGAKQLKSLLGPNVTIDLFLTGWRWKNVLF